MVILEWIANFGISWMLLWLDLVVHHASEGLLGRIGDDMGLNSCDPICIGIDV